MSSHGRRLTTIIAVVLILFSVGAASGSARGARTATSSGCLRVDGAEIVDASGEPVLLSGVNMDTWYYAHPANGNSPLQYATVDDVRFLADLGLNVVRLCLHWKYFDTDLGFDLIDDYVGWCRNEGMYVILDMHITPPDDRLSEDGIWYDPSARERFLDLWGEIAARYSGDPVIAGYDIFNEPDPPDPDLWWDLVDDCIVEIRSVDPDHIIFIENPMSGNREFELLDDPNIVYSFHYYQPYTVTHAGADWLGDTSVSSEQVYPGRVLTGIRWADWSSDAAVYTDRSRGWLHWDSGPLEPPDGVEFATVKLFAYGDCGTVRFDDVDLTVNGTRAEVRNAGMEDASRSDADRPADWSFWGEGSYTGSWAEGSAHGGRRSLEIDPGDDGFGAWSQTDWIMTEQLFPVGRGDSFRAGGWLRAPDNEGGIVVGLDYLNGVYEYYDRDRLRDDLLPYLQWSWMHDVPLFVGEFGVMSTAPGNSRVNLLADLVGLMDDEGLHRTLWTYRTGSTGYGLILGDQPDDGLVEVLRNSGTTAAR